jgi:hypothetical protein
MASFTFGLLSVADDDDFEDDDDPAVSCFFILHSVMDIQQNCTVICCCHKTDVIKTEQLEKRCLDCLLSDHGKSCTLLSPGVQNGHVKL